VTSAGRGTTPDASQRAITLSRFFTPRRADPVSADNLSGLSRETKGEYPSEFTAITSVAHKLGVGSPETPRKGNASVRRSTRAPDPGPVAAMAVGYGYPCLGWHVGVFLAYSSLCVAICAKEG